MQPSQRDPAHRRSAFLCHLAQAIEHTAIRFVAIKRMRFGVAFRPCCFAGGQRGLFEPVAGEPAPRQRAVNDDTQSVFVAEGQHVPFFLAKGKVVLKLRRGDAHARFEFSDEIGARKLPCGEVGKADVQHFASAYEVAENAERFLNRRGGIGFVQLVQIHVVGFQAPKRGVDAIVDVFA